MANGFTADFSISALEGVDLDRLTFTARFNEMDSGETGTLILRSSADDFASDLVSVTNGTTTGTSDIPIEIDLTDFSDVTDMTFRFYFLGSNSATNERTRVVGPVTLFSVGLPGDFDGDGDIDGHDLLHWQQNDGSPSGLAQWQAAYDTAAVPEPSTVVVSATLGLLISVQRPSGPRQ